MSTFAFAAVAVSGPAAAERIVRSLPHSENFDTNAYASDAIWLTGGARQTWMPSAGWRGGAAKFFPPTVAQNYSGLGQFILSLSTVPEQLNVRWLMYHGTTWREYAQGEKLIILNRNGNRGRPMIILRESSSGGQTWETMGACDGTVCRYEGGDYWPDGTDRLKIGNPPVAREAEWISVEFEANTRTGMIRLYVDTQDGALSGLYIERPMDDTGTGGTWAYIDVIGGFFNNASTADENNYVMFDELVIDSKKIGPPAGFGSSTRPQPPTNVSVQ
ncbi:hypothetical protein [Steroidobacter sp.]|uniref:hypothetical protein n=1 Tax=Steroidobacter sp. TaxID=1978227 RepID=UPI001A5F75D8|nr:hypothetical protein [Steroidobacter sp.]MBL8269759.1 hypothetical protein [Steroidobacter sp.]